MNLQDENPTIVFGPKLDEKACFPPPFYITMIVHDKMLHNFLLDYGASHNLIPKVVMEALELSITNPFRNPYAFESRAVKCIWVIKNLVVSLSQIPMKSILTDVVVVDIPQKHGMLLYRSCTKKNREHYR